VQLGSGPAFCTLPKTCTLHYVEMQYKSALNTHANFTERGTACEENKHALKGRRKCAVAGKIIHVICRRYYNFGNFSFQPSNQRFELLFMNGKKATIRVAPSHTKKYC